MLAETNEGYHNLIKVVERARTSTATTTSPAPTGSCSSGTTRASPPPPAASAALVSQLILKDENEAALKRGRALPGHLRARHFFVELQDHGHRGRRARSSSRCSTSRAKLARAAARHERQSLHAQARRRSARRVALRADRRVADATRSASSSTATTSTSRARPRCAHVFSEAPEACDNTLLIAERADVEIEFGQAVLPSFPVPEGHDENSYLRELTMQGREGALRHRARAARDRAHRVRARRHQVDGLPGVLPRRLGPRPLREVARHPGRSGAGERGGLVRRVLPAHRRHRPDQVRPAVRAVPEPGPQADARHRHGLRLPLPRRDDQVRRAEVRRRPRRADRHVLDDQGAGRGARRRARARLPVRRRRQDRQAHAAAHHGPRHAAASVLREARTSTPTATRWRSDLRAALRRRSRRQARHRRRPRARRTAPPGRHPRRRGRDHPRTAHRVPADPAQARAGHGDRRRADRHPVRDARRRGPRPPQDGLPRPAQPRRRSRSRSTSSSSRTGARPDIDDVAARRPADLRPVAATPTRSACSSSKAGRCARCSRSIDADLVRRRRRCDRALPPGPDGAELAQRVRRPQERSQAGHVRPPRPRRDPRADLRADDLPRAAHASVAEARRATRSKRPTTCARRRARRSAP